MWKLSRGERASQVEKVFTGARQTQVEKLLQNLVLGPSHATRVVDALRRAPARLLVVVTVEAVGVRMRVDADVFEDSDEEVVHFVIQDGRHLDELAVVVVGELSRLCNENITYTPGNYSSVFKSDIPLCLQRP